MGFFKSKRFYFAILLSLGTLIFLFQLGGRDLWEPDETRYAVVARDMRENGNWILPHLNGKVYAEKPPLFFWLVNLSVFFFGVDNELTNRLPSALAGLITVLVTSYLGKSFFNAQVGFISGLVLCTCIFFPLLSRWMMLDSILTLFFLLALSYLYRGLEEEENRRKHYLLAGFFIGLGVLTKGPIAYLPIPIVLIFTFLQKKFKSFWCTDLLWGFLLSMGIILIWWIPACFAGGKDYINWILFKQVVGTYIEGGKHFHPKPLSFYFIRFPIEFFPWIVFLPSAFIIGLKTNRMRKEFLFLSIWFIFIFIFFTLSKGKKDNYLLPLYPASAMMVGVLWDSESQLAKKPKGFIIGLILLTLFFFIGMVVFLSGILQTLYPSIVEYRTFGIYLLSYLTIGSFFSLLLFVWKKKWPSFILLIITFTIFHLHLSYAIPPKLNPQRSMKYFSERILKRMKPGDEIKTYWFKSNGLIYYTKKSYIEEIETPDRFKEVFYSPQKVFIVIFRKMFEKLKSEVGVEMEPIDQAKVGHWEYILISNH
jgi:4-amino-4-deoxy-L-arabinose transferase-like glycosyltransferase